MTLYEYKLLSDHEQYDLLFTKGEFITSRIQMRYRYVLYSLFNFFVELEYNTTENKIVNRVSFITGEKLDIYSKL